MRNVLFTWIGGNDFKGMSSTDADRVGPIAAGVASEAFDAVYVLHDYPVEKVAPYKVWLGSRSGSELHFLHVPLEDIMGHEEVYGRVVGVLEAHARKGKDRLTFHLSPGTPTMHSVWLLLAKTKFPARLIQSSPERGVQEANVPFDIALELHELLRDPDALLSEFAESRARVHAFEQLTYRSRVMRELVALAHRVAQRKVSVLLLGESGTGKEVFAKAIHNASPRAGRPMVVVNCGAIPENLVEAELFGHTKNAFTGAGEARAGHFREASGGTLFLDEIGELPLAVQVKLLRVLQEETVVPVGSSKEVPIDVRVVAATHRYLPDEVRAGSFREDLFYRLAVAVLELPPLRERKGDLNPLIDALLAEINEEQDGHGPAEATKDLSVGARKKLQQHHWPGNVRELRNTLLRAMVFARTDRIRADDVVLFPALAAAGDRVLGRPLGEGLNVPELLADVELEYIDRAMEEAGGNKTEAAKLLGYKSYQALDYRMKKLRGEDKKSVE